jgi:ribosomal protein S18 acetylase RimI-like enzyme
MTAGDRQPGENARPTITPATERDADVLDVLAEAVGGDTTKTADVLARYRRDRAWQLLTAELGGRCVGVAGYTVDDSEVTLLHIAVVPTDRRTGYGRALISAVLARNQHCQRVVAETDADAVGFYRALGFVVTLLGEKYAGIERFRVCLNVDVHETEHPGKGHADDRC